MEQFYRIANSEILLDIKAIPGASRTEAAGTRNRRLCIRIARAPENGKANAELCEFIARSLGCSQKDVMLVKGGKSRLKTIAIPCSYRVKLEEMGEWGKK